MNSKSKNVNVKSSVEFRTVIKSFHVLCFSFAFLCFSTSFLSAQTETEQLSSTDFLLPYLNEILHDVNTPAVRTQQVRPGPGDSLMPYLEKTLSYVNTLTGQTQQAGTGTGDFMAPFLEKTLSYVNTPTVQTKKVKTGPIPQEKPQAGKTVSIDPITEANQNLPHMDSVVPAYINTQYGRQLWQARTSAHQDREDNKSKIKLKQLIEQIRSIEFKPKKPHPEPVITVEPVETNVEPNETPFIVEVIKETEKQTTESKSPYEPVTNQTLQMLAGIAQDPNELENPFELGEVLYASGHPREAAMFYREALNRIDNDKTKAARNRPWILFQLANSLREHDLPEAKKIYVKLITEHPESPWVDLAKTRGKIIDWFLKDKPQTLINERQS